MSSLPPHPHCGECSIESPLVVPSGPHAVPGQTRRAVRARQNAAGIGFAFLWVAAVLISIAGDGCGGSSASTTSPRKTPRPPGTPVDRGDLIDEARSWIGTRYRYGGSDRDGMDCSGFVYRVFERSGILLPRSSKEMFELGRPVNRSGLREGDLVFFANTAGAGITHVGIFLTESQFVHSSTTKGVIISSLDDQYYARHYAGARRVLE